MLSIRLLAPVTIAPKRNGAIVTGVLFFLEGVRGGGGNFRRYEAQRNRFHDVLFCPVSLYGFMCSLFKIENTVKHLKKWVI